MSSDRIVALPVLSREEYAALDACGASCPGTASLPRLAAFLRDRFGLDVVLDPDIVAGFLTDSSNLPGRAQALARPATERDGAVILRACFAAGVPLTVCGGRSNLTGSATPQEGMVLSTLNMLEPAVSIGADGATVRAPVGMILEDLRKQVLAQTAGRLQFPVDPTSRTDASVGGALACNASGFTPGEGGASRRWVEAVDFLLPDGFKIGARRGQYVSREGRFVLAAGDGAERAWPVPRYARPPVKNAAGPYSAADGVMDFVDLVVGSEGILGLVTGCVLRLEETPSAYLDLFFSLVSENGALALLDYLRGHLAGGLSSLTALEYFGVNCRAHMKHEGRLFQGDHRVAVYVQVPLSARGPDEAAEEWLGLLAAADCGIVEDAILILDNDRDRALFLEARHSMPANAVEVVQHRGTHTVMTDTVVPPERFREFLAFAHETIRAAGLDYLSFGHLGDCHLHFTILPEKDQLERAVAAYDAIVARSAALGGVYSGEHGTGKRKRADFLRCYGPQAVAEVQRCKAAVDPRFLLNRGNVVEPPAPSQG